MILSEEGARAERMLELHTKKAVAPQAGESLTLLERQLTATDQQIDRIVYEMLMYELTEDEIKIVEEN